MIVVVVVVVVTEAAVVVDVVVRVYLFQFCELTLLTYLLAILHCMLQVVVLRLAPRRLKQ